jgi:hypothetical protein
MLQKVPKNSNACNRKGTSNARGKKKAKAFFVLFDFVGE